MSYHWCNIYILFGVLEKSDQLGDFTVNTSDYIDWLGGKTMTKKHFDVPGFIHWSMGCLVFFKVKSERVLYQNQILH